MSDLRNVQLLGRDSVVSALSQYNTVIVTGPQRSGTTIVSAMLAQDLDIPYVDEAEYGNAFGKLLLMAHDPNPLVIQSPVMASCIEKIGAIEGCAVVWMLRDSASIIRSQDRVAWTVPGEALEKNVYQKAWGVTSGRICDIKLRVWNERQKPLMQVPWYEIDYNGTYVQEHPLFVPQPARSGFGRKQTQVGYGRAGSLTKWKASSPTLNWRVR